ncbi:MAG: CvpA family protein [Clostridia bacterium]|nr:CvpA family protein [Clostridia bacterium]
MNGIGLLIDIFFIVVALIIVIVSAKRGFVKNVIRLASFILSIIIAVTFSPTLSEYIAEKWVAPAVTEGVYEDIVAISQRNGGTTFDIASLFATEHEEFVEILEKFGVDFDALAQTFENISNGTEQTVRELADNIVEKVVNGISTVLAFVALFFASLLVLWLVSLILGLVVKLPVLKQLNTLLGIVCGLVTSLAVFYLFATLGVQLIEKLSAVYPAISPDQIRENSFILKNFSSLKSILSLVGIEY